MPSPLITAGKITEWQSLYSESHPWALALKAQADGAVVEEIGVVQIIAYHMTGTASYLTDAKAKFLAWFSQGPADRNTSREFSVTTALMYMWLEPHYNAGELEDLQAVMDIWATGMLGYEVGHGTGIGDSDEVSCHMLGLLLYDMAMGDTTYQEMAASSGSLNVTEMLVEFEIYLDRAAGGEWIESREYNSGTVQIILLGILARGIGWFSAGLQTKINTFILEHGEQQRWLLCQDYAECVKWGDTEHEHSPVPASLVPIACIAIGAGGDPEGLVANWLANFLNVNNPNFASQHNLWRALLVFDPRDLPASPVADDIEGLRYASGVGLAIYNKGNHHVEVFGATAVHVQHEWNATNVRWAITTNGVSEFVLDAIQGYATSPQVMNTPLMAGLPFMFDRGIVTAQEISGGFETIWHTEGERYPQPFFDPPPAFGEITRTCTFLDSGTLTVADEFTGAAPTNTDRYLYYSDEYYVTQYPHLWMQIWHVPHATGIPTATAEGYTWTTPGGKVMNLVTDAPNKRVDTVTGGTLTATYSKEVIPGIAVNGYINEGERGGWIIQLGTDTTPTATITTSFTAEGEAPPAGFDSRRSLRQLLMRR
jgi:hypothetical protein